jgi:undecaprenyl-diphosphatase
MDIIQAVILALIQGITEFLPISSSGHLVLPSEILGWQDQGLAFDVAVHVGTLVAVMTYLRKELVEIIGGWFSGLAGKQNDAGRLGWLLILATIPASIVGLLLDDFIELHLRSVAVIACTTIFFGLILGVADRYNHQTLSLYEIGFKVALIIGFAQALALIPGTSRSGITMTAALFLGCTRDASARFSFLMSIPIILLSGAYKGFELLGEAGIDWQMIGVGVAVSAISAYICIYCFMSFISRIGMMPFVYYRLVLGCALFAFMLV